MRFKCRCIMEEPWILTVGMNNNENILHMLRQKDLELVFTSRVHTTSWGGLRLITAIILHILPVWLIMSAFKLLEPKRVHHGSSLCKLWSAHPEEQFLCLFYEFGKGPCEFSNFLRFLCIVTLLWDIWPHELPSVLKVIFKFGENFYQNNNTHFFLIFKQSHFHNNTS